MMLGSREGVNQLFKARIRVYQDKEVSTLCAQCCAESI